VTAGLAVALAMAPTALHADDNDGLGVNNAHLDANNNLVLSIVDPWDRFGQSAHVSLAGVPLTIVSANTSYYYNGWFFLVVCDQRYNCGEDAGGCGRGSICGGRFLGRQ